MLFRLRPKKRLMRLGKVNELTLTPLKGGHVLTILPFNDEEYAAAIRHLFW